MQGKRGNPGVRIRIHPGVGGAGIVDRKDLNQLESGVPRPIRKRGQIQKFADAKTPFAAQAEDGDGDARSAPRWTLAAHEAVVHNHLSIRGAASASERSAPSS